MRTRRKPYDLGDMVTLRNTHHYMGRRLPERSGGVGDRGVVTDAFRPHHDFVKVRWESGHHSRVDLYCIDFYDDGGPS